MNVFILGTFLIIAISPSLLKKHGPKFKAFKEKYSKAYTDDVEETKRFAIFKNNLNSIDKQNALYKQGLVTYKQGITKFADMTQKEFKAMLALQQKPVYNTTKYVKSEVAVSSTVDWRTQGQVTGVKEQGSCGACWSFSVTGSTEGAYYRKTGNLTSFSEQQLIDCSTDINSGCNGGYLDATFPYVEQYGLQTEDSYPYTGTNDSCKYNSSKVVTKVNKYVSISEDESSLLEAVGSIGPVSVAIDATYLSLYESGIYSDNSCSPYSLNHGVLAVGYGTENDQDYWIVKNSWGSDWGEEGYFRIVRGANECGIAEDNVYPIIN